MEIKGLLSHMVSFVPTTDELYIQLLYVRTTYRRQDLGSHQRKKKQNLKSIHTTDLFQISCGVTRTHDSRWMILHTA
jgi:hypothetical protein